MTAEPGPGGPRSLYVHLPFCERRCHYCDFAVQVGGLALQGPYVEALLHELATLARAAPPARGLDTVSLGGGTPSLLPLSLLSQLLEGVQASLGVASGAEVTLEANPSDLSPALARAWRDLGVNRVSLGVQSLDDRTLRWLGRNHDRRAAQLALEALLEAGLANLSCDLIYSVPDQPAEAFEASLERVLAMGVPHLSCYELTVEPKTELWHRVHLGQVRPPSDDAALAQMRLAERTLARAGLRRYEVSNYARPGFESRHNLAYWRGHAWLAAGCGAHGFLDRNSAARLGLGGGRPGTAVRYWNRRSARSYIRQVADLGHGRQGHEELGAADLRLERLACGLRVRSGARLDGPGQRQRARELADLGLLRLHRGRAAPSDRGWELVDAIALELARAAEAGAA